MTLPNEIQKFKDGENFPVAKIIPKKFRQPIIDFYHFARATDEISDSKTLEKSTANQHLIDIYSNLKSENISALPQYAQKILEHHHSGTFDKRHCQNLLSAFIQDTQKSRYKSWADTIEYCRYSAAPVGKIVLETCQEFDADFTASDNICVVLQLINHLQDIKKDFQNLNRIYFDATIIPEIDINNSSETAEFSVGKKKIINNLFKLLDTSNHLPKTIHSRTLSLELEFIIQICYSLLNKISKNDILKSHIKLTKGEYAICFAKALAKNLFKKPFTALSKKIALSAKSSFVTPLLKLPAQKREDMLCFYSYCRLLDDIADTQKLTIAQKQKDLNLIEQDIENIYAQDLINYFSSPIISQLNLVVHRHKIPKQHLISLINGQRADLVDIQYPQDAELEEYIYNVAGVVGLVSSKIFGYAPKNQPAIEAFSLHLAKALQIINILRDIPEDAARNRVYLPISLFENLDIPTLEPKKIISNIPSTQKLFRPISQKFAKIAEENLAQAFNSLPPDEISNMQIAIMMSKVYQKYLDKMIEHSFIFSREDIKLSFAEKIKILKL